MVNSKGGANSNTYLTKLTEISEQFNKMYEKYFGPENKTTATTNNTVNGQSNKIQNNTDYSKRVKGFLDALTNWSNLIEQYEKSKEDLNISQKISPSEKKIIEQYLNTVKNMKKIIEQLVESDKNECKPKLAVCQAKYNVLQNVLKMPKNNKK